MPEHTVTVAEGFSVYHVEYVDGLLRERYRLRQEAEAMRAIVDTLRLKSESLYRDKEELAARLEASRTSRAELFAQTCELHGRIADLEARLERRRWWKPWTK